MIRSISAQATAHVPFRHAEKFLRRPPLGIFGVRPEGAPSPRHFLTTLAADAPGGMAVAHGVDIEVVAVRAGRDHVEVELRWVPTGGKALLPSFTGALRAEPAADGATALALEGSYAVPLGVIGRFGDGVLGNRVARRSVEDLLERIAGRVERMTLDSLTRPPVSPTPRPPDMRRHARAEVTR